MLVGGITAGAQAAGGSVAVVGIGQKTEAYIASNATITAGSDATDDILVHARLDIDVDGRAYAGSFSATGSFAAQAVVVKDTSLQSAHIDDNANIVRAGGTVTVQALVDRDVSVQTIGGAVSSGVAIGASIAIADVQGSTTAEVRGANIGQTAAVVRNLTVTAENDSRVTARAIAVSGGLLVGISGAVATANIAPNVTAGITANSDVTVSGDVFIDARAFDNAVVDAIGVAIAGGASGGAAVALATLAPVLLVTIGNNSRVTGRNVRQRRVA